MNVFPSKCHIEYKIFFLFPSNPDTSINTWNFITHYSFDNHKNFIKKEKLFDKRNWEIVHRYLILTPTLHWISWRKGLYVNHGKSYWVKQRCCFEGKIMKVKYWLSFQHIRSICICIIHIDLLLIMFPYFRFHVCVFFFKLFTEQYLYNLMLYLNKLNLQHPERRKIDCLRSGDRGIHLVLQIPPLLLILANSTVSRRKLKVFTNWNVVVYNVSVRKHRKKV